MAQVLFSMHSLVCFLLLVGAGGKEMLSSTPKRTNHHPPSDVTHKSSHTTAREGAIHGVTGHTHPVHRHDNYTLAVITAQPTAFPFVIIGFSALMGVILLIGLGCFFSCRKSFGGVRTESTLFEVADEKLLAAKNFGKELAKMKDTGKSGQSKGTNRKDKTKTKPKSKATSGKGKSTKAKPMSDIKSAVASSDASVAGKAEKSSIEATGKSRYSKKASSSKSSKTSRAQKRASAVSANTSTVSTAVAASSAASSTLAKSSMAPKMHKSKKPNKKSKK